MGLVWEAVNKVEKGPGGSGGFRGRCFTELPTTVEARLSSSAFLFFLRGETDVCQSFIIISYY